MCQMVLDNVASGSGPEHDLNLSAAKAREAAAAAAAAAARRALRCDQKPSSQYEYLRELADVVECICEMNLHEDTVRLEGCPGVLEYLVRFTEESGCSPAVFLLMFVYLRRVTRDEFELNYRTAHYLVLACFVIAAKMHDDHSRSNKYYASLGGVTLQELNSLEACVLKSLDWNLSTSHAECVGLEDMLHERRCSQ